MKRRTRLRAKAQLHRKARLQVRVTFGQRAGRKSQLQRSGQLAKRSTKTARQVRQYAPEAQAFLDANPWCEYPLGCGQPSVVVHHRWGRNGARLRDQQWWAASCDRHNLAAEDATGEARACKWLLDLNGVPPATELGRAFLKQGRNGEAA